MNTENKKRKGLRIKKGKGCQKRGVEIKGAARLRLKKGVEKESELLDTILIVLSQRR